MSWMTKAFLVLMSATLIGSGLAGGGLFDQETVGERFRKALKEIEDACAKRRLEPNEVCGAVAKLKPADPLATEEGRFAHSLKIPNPVPADSGYKPGMTSQEYFDHLCKTEAGEFIYKTAESVEGIYMIRRRERVFDDHLAHLYAMEDPYGYTDWEAREPQTVFVDPPWRNYSFFEAQLETTVTPRVPGARYRRFYRGQSKGKIVEEQVTELQSRYGYIWRGIARPNDRELGIAGGELIVLDRKTGEVLGVRRGFIRTGGVRNRLTGTWWLSGQVCPELRSDQQSQKEGDFTYWFVSKVLKPITVSTEGSFDGTK